MRKRTGKAERKRTRKGEKITRKQLRTKKADEKEQGKRRN
jgi:hypothetical protein